MSRSAVLLSFADSGEFRQAIPADNSVALDYLNLLGRAPDQGGLDYWVNQQSTPLPEITMLGGFIASAEFHDWFLP